MKDLSVIVVNFNTKAITNQCLDKLKESKKYCEEELKNKIEVIVVDNASSDNSVAEIKKNHSWVKLIESKENTGFGGGNNLGIKNSKYPLILLLNSDAFVKKETLKDAVFYMEANPFCDILGCKLEFKDGRLQPSAGYLPNIFNTFTWIMGLDILFPFIKQIHPRDPKFFRSIRQVDWVMGAFFLAKNEVFERSQGFDEKLFMYSEEVELSMRTKKLGYKTFYNPNFSITHLDKASSNFNIEKPLLSEIKGLLYIYKKHNPSILWLVKIILFKGLILRIIAFSFLGRIQRVNAYKDSIKLLFQS